jgi:hypothetical protein
MPLYDKHLRSINEADLDTLVATQDTESKLIEYKEELPGATPSDRKEFLADVASFSNAIGGDLLIGIRSVKGVPTEVNGVQISNVDAEVLRLEEIIRNNIRPRIPFDIHTIKLSDANKGVVFVIRVRKGFATPHQITLDKDYRFYSRNSAGKYRLDVDELRTIFELSLTTSQHIRDFRAERLADIISGQTPVPVLDHAKIVVHVVPFASFDATNTYDVASLVRPYARDYLRPLSYPGTPNFRHNFDGILRPEKSGDSGTNDAYVQLFRSGIIESVDAWLLEERWRTDLESGRSYQAYISADDLEDALIEALPEYLAAQEKLGVEPPIFVLASLLGVANHAVTYKRRTSWRSPTQPIEKNDLIVPEIRIDNFDVDPAHALRPLFDIIANAGGWARSINYDNEGNRLAAP